MKLLQLITKTSVLVSALACAYSSPLFAQSSKIAEYAQSVDQTSQGMTLLQILQSGGIVMIVLGILSIFTLTLVIFLFMRLKQERLIPTRLCDEIVSGYSNGQFNKIKILCENNDSLIGTIANAGVREYVQNNQMRSEAIEQTARKEVSSLWNSLNHLSDIAQVAPMLGLLGTVVGMIQAFNTIAFDSAVVKPILLAGGVAKAMVTTAAGLVIAIITIFFYALLRSRLQLISQMIETKVTQIISSLDQK